VRPAQATKVHDRAVAKIARQLKARADQRRFRPNVPFGQAYALPENQAAYTATLGVHGWTFGLGLVVHEDGVSHWRGIARLRNGFSSAPSAEDLDVLGIFVGEVTHDDPAVLTMLREQLEGDKAPDGVLHFMWFEGANAPKSPLDGVLRGMGALMSDAIEKLADTELSAMREHTARAHDELVQKGGKGHDDADTKLLLEKIDEAATLLEAEEIRRRAKKQEMSA
jgi:hypothetical protein